MAGGGGGAHQQGRARARGARRFGAAACVAAVKCTLPALGPTLESRGPLLVSHALVAPYGLVSPPVGTCRKCPQTPILSTPLSAPLFLLVSKRPSPLVGGWVARPEVLVPLLTRPRGDACIAPRSPIRRARPTAEWLARPAAALSCSARAAPRSDAAPPCVGSEAPRGSGAGCVWLAGARWLPDGCSAVATAAGRGLMKRCAPRRPVGRPGTGLRAQPRSLGDRNAVGLLARAGSMAARWLPDGCTPAATRACCQRGRVARL